jgi:hypothetical protein
MPKTASEEADPGRRIIRPSDKFTGLVFVGGGRGPGDEDGVQPSRLGG